MDRSLIFIGGKGPEDISFLELDIYSKIICADSGYDKARAFDITPDVVIGDMDSTHLRSEIVEKGFIPCSHDKDDSDFTLALKECEGDYDLVGGGEGRLDHLISIFSTFKAFRPPKLWLTREDVIFSSMHFKAKMERDYSISFFPADISSLARVSTKGLVWDLDEHEVSLSFISLSNRVKDGRVEIDSTIPLLIRFPMDFFRVKPKILLC